MFRTFFLRLSPLYQYKISGNSMYPTFSASDIIFVNRLAYVFVHPQLNDIIALHDPRDGKVLIKRIIKIEGKGYFVQGDNKNSSTDSRVFGMIGRRDIIGKVIRIL
jgi:nickel-type superoxide dismutase maturation protease